MSEITTTVTDTETVTTTENTEDSNSVLDVLVDKVTFAVTRSIKSPDAEPGFGELKRGNALWRDSQPADDGDTSAITKEIILTIEVEVPSAGTLAGIAQIVTDGDELLAISNDGIYDKLKRQIKAKYTQRKDGEFIYGNDTLSLADATDIINTPAKRRSQSEAQQMAKVLNDLRAKNPDMLMTLLKSAGILS